jgi:phosphoribosyl-dephospho-CoA transferase
VLRSHLFIHAKPHDLLELDSPQSIANLDCAPAWVRESLEATSYVVVRRQAQSETEVAIGVRGPSRHQRWPSFVNPNKIKSVVSPFQLHGGNQLTSERAQAIPALRHLLALERKWRDLDLKWGPGGSVGFELATGNPAATDSSDLDIVLFAPVSFDHEFARILMLSVSDIAKTIDVLVETPESAFLLSEYAANPSAPILLRCADKARLGINPWRTDCMQNCSLSEITKAELESIA